MTLGQYIASERKKRGFSQKDLAARILKEDGKQISPQYLNDIELGRRHPSSDHLLQQFANQLAVDIDYLYWLVAEFPPDIRDGPYEPETVRTAFKAFRQTLGKGKQQ